MMYSVEKTPVKPKGRTRVKVEKVEEALPKFFKKPKELPTTTESRRLCKDFTLREKVLSEKFSCGTGQAGKHPGYDGEWGITWDNSTSFRSLITSHDYKQSAASDILAAITQELYLENDSLRRANETLFANQKLMAGQISTLLDGLKQKGSDIVTECSNEEVAELRRLNTSLLVNQQAMAKELASMRADMVLMRQFLPTAVAVPVENPLVSLGTKI